MNRQVITLNHGHVLCNCSLRTADSPVVLEEGSHLQLAYRHPIPRSDTAHLSIPRPWARVRLVCALLCLGCAKQDDDPGTWGDGRGIREMARRNRLAWLLLPSHQPEVRGDSEGENPVTIDGSCQPEWQGAGVDSDST